MPKFQEPTTAILLAAGVNRRLGDSPLPKPFLSLDPVHNGPSFLDRQVAELVRAGIEEVRIVVSQQARTRCPEELHERASYVVNPFDTSCTGTSLSVLTGVRATPADHAILVLDGDIVYERSLLQWLVNECKDTRLFTSGLICGDDEEVRVYADAAGAPRVLGKGLPEA